MTLEAQKGINDVQRAVREVYRMIQEQRKVTMPIQNESFEWQKESNKDICAQ